MGYSVKSIQIIRRVAIGIDNPSDRIKLSSTQEAVTDEVYDLSKPDHRKDLFDKIVHDAYFASKYDNAVLDKLVDELNTVIEDLKDELPFS